MRTALWVIVLMVLLPLVAHSAPTVRPYYDAIDHFEIKVTFGSDLDDSPAIPTGGMCAVSFVSATGTVQLWAVPTAATAASSGTQIGADFTASTTTGPRKFSPGLPYLKAVATVAATGSVMTIRCSNSQVAGGGDSVNSASDTDGDGLADFIRIRASSSTTGSEIQALIDSLDDTGPKRIEFDGIMDYSYMDASADMTWDATNIIELAANTSLECVFGSRIYGPSLAFWQDRWTATRMISNATGADNVHVKNCFVENTELLVPFDSDPENDNATECVTKGASGGTNGEWCTTSLFGGVHFTGCNGCSAVGNIVRGSPHSGFFVTSSSGSTFAGNLSYASGETFNTKAASLNAHTTLADTEPAGETSLNLTAALTNCAVDDWILVELDETDPLAKSGTTRKLWAAGWVTATGDPITIRRSALASGRNPGLPSQATAGNRVFCSEGDKHAFETYSENATVARNNQIVGNRAELISGVAFQIRGVSLVDDECEDNTDVTCWHGNAIVADNVGVDVNGELFQVRGSRGARITGNSGIRSGGATFTSSTQTCSEPFDTGDDTGKLECTRDTYLSGNTIQDCRPNAGSAAAGGGCVRFNGGHETVIWTGDNLVDGTVGGVAFTILGDMTASEVHMAARNVESSCLTDGQNSAGTSQLTRPLYGSANFTNCGLGFATGTPSNAPAVAWRDDHTARITFDPFIVRGVVASAFFIDPIGAYDIQMPNFMNVSVDGSWAGYSGTFATIAAMDAAVQCTPAFEGVTAIIQNGATSADCSAGGGSAEAWCRCNGSDMVNVTPETARDVFMVLSGNSVDGGGIYGGTITNALASGSSLINLSSSTGGSDGFSIMGVTLAKGAEGMLTADAPLGIQEQTGSITNLTVDGLTFDGITAANRYSGLESGDFSAFSRVVDIDTPSDPCTNGALYVDSDNTTTGLTLYVCENALWNGLD